MKIRIKEQSIRFRLTKSDISNLATNGELAEQTRFLSNTFSYAIKRTDSDMLEADFLNGTITLYIPGEMVDELISTDRVGFSSDSGTVKILIEKDFTCLDNTIEDQSDNYPNPLLA